MNLKAAFCFIPGMLAACLFYAQDLRAQGARHSVKAKTTVAVPQEDDYDVRYVKMELDASNTSTAISGRVSTTARVVAATMSEYYFELSNQLTIDSAKLNGQSLTAVQVNNYVNKLVLPVPLAQNAVFTAEVFYHGAPAGGTGFFTNGILNQTDGSVPVQVTHTVSAAIHSRDWWPCKQSLTDKIDSADILITVPTGLKVASNGLLRNITPVSGGFNRYEWASRYPADYYLLSFSIAPYDEYNYYVHFTGSNDSMLVQNYIYNDPSVLQQHQDELDSIGQIINYFSGIFGRYPFDKEKFGICMTPLGGGMENQTMVSLGSLDITLIAHELSHQWWGDNVTCASLYDMWLNEGWATYSEQLFLERFHGSAAMTSHRTAQYSQIMFSSGGSVYVDDTTNEGRIYSSRLTYYKGAAVAHMLRYMINNDSLFFHLLRSFHQQYQYGNATTGDLKQLAMQVSGQDLDTFFHQWVYREGHPTYAAKWAQSGNQVVVRLSQTTSKPSSVPVFKMPVEIQLKSPQGDTVIRVLNDHNTQYYTFNWSKPMSGMVIDPGNHILNKTGPIANDTVILGIAGIRENQIDIFPNPSATAWHVKNLPQPARLTVVDVSGKKVWESGIVSDTASIPSAHLAPGTYMLTITDKDRSYSYHLVR